MNDPFKETQESRLILRALRQTLWKLGLYKDSYLVLRTDTHDYCLKYGVIK